MLLSHTAMLVFVLIRSGCVGRLAWGRIARIGPTGLNVYNADDAIIDYISGSNLRSWGVLGLDGTALPGWHEIAAEDLPKFTRV